MLDKPAPIVRQNIPIGKAVKPRYHMASKQQVSQQVSQQVAHLKEAGLLESFSKTIEAL